MLLTYKLFIRRILFSFVLITLTACSDEDPVADHHEESVHAGHNDGEHIDINSENKHDGLEQHSGHHDETGRSHEKHKEETNTVHLKPEQMKIANIIVKPLLLNDAAITIRAPGEIKLNAYQTIKVSPRINAQIIKRHAYLGDEVTKGQVLVTLSSVEMAQAQGQLLLADKEWKRVKKLGRKMISESRYMTAKIEYGKAFASTTSYGMNKKEINALLAQKRSADGSFQLYAKQAGRILHDKFIVGEYIEAGYELMLIADESTMWVEARVTPDIAGQIDVGNSGEILINKKHYSAKVIQLHHTLDEITRTTSIRLEVNNKDDQLHPGMFVSALISTRNKSKALQLPEAAVLRSSDGDWQIFVEQNTAGEFKAVEVKVIQFNSGQAIIEGIPAGTRVVTQGAFFVQSELAKGGFEIHNH